MEIHVFGLVMGLLLLAVPYILLGVFDSRMGRKFTIATFRMLLSVAVLSALAFLSRYDDKVYLDVLIALAIVIVSSVVIVHRAKLLVRHYFLPVLVGQFVSVAVMTAYLLFIVMTATNGSSLRFLLPIAAILSASSVVATSEALFAYRTGLECQSRLYYYLVGNGASHAEALYYFVRRAMQRAVMPSIRHFGSIGLSAAPIMMWIMIADGVSVFTAAAFQVIMVAAMAATTILAVILTLLIARRYTIDEYGRLKPNHEQKEAVSVIEPPTEAD